MNAKLSSESFYDSPELQVLESDYVEQYNEADEIWEMIEASALAGESPKFWDHSMFPAWKEARQKALALKIIWHKAIEIFEKGEEDGLF